MTAADISRAKGGENFLFTYDYADVAQTFTFSGTDWGLYKADGTVSVNDTVTPAFDDNNTSKAGAWTGSVSLAHLESFSSAHVTWQGSGFTVEYTLNGTTWTGLTQHGVVDLSGDPDFDIRVKFAGGVVDDPAELISLTVYVLKTDTLKSERGLRTLTFSADPLNDGIYINTPVSVSAAATQTGIDLRIGTIEMWVTLDSGTTAFVSPPAGSYYTNGALGSPTAGARRHVVYVLNSLANTTFTIGPNMKVESLAVYPEKMTAAEVGNLYAAHIGGVFRVDDAGSIAVTEDTPATEIYAYAWSIVSGSSR